jgi:hypothetical protein
MIPDKPKIIVLGASGRIGRRVVRQLLERPGLDATIVACCRDYDKACRVLYDDLLVLASHFRGDRGGGRPRKGPRLQIVQLDLVPPQELPGYSYNEEGADEAEWRRRASSAAKFYRNSMKEYDDRDPSPILPAPSGVVNNEALQDAIRGCTAIVSCVGAVRPTHLWSDILSRPVVRLLRPDVSSWCKDSRHPYYVHYRSTRKVLACAEREQLRREAAAAAAAAEPSASRNKNRRLHPSSRTEDDGLEEENEREVPPTPKVPRIRFVRISDLCVSQPPWALVPWVVNVFWSLVFRYQDMAEQLLASSSVLETVVIRPGDLVDEIRDENSTYVQVGSDGCVAGPSIVGRDDVAALAVAAALFDPTDKEREQHEPFHYTLGVRWVGQDMDPYPPQGCASDGFPTAHLALQSALRSIRKRDKLRRRKLLLHEQRARGEPSSLSAASSLVRVARAVPRSRMHSAKPYGLCVAVPVYLVLAALARKAFQTVLPYLPSAVQDALRSALAFCLSSAALILQGRVGIPLPLGGPRLSWLRRGGIHKYISF